MENRKQKLKYFFTYTAFFGVIFFLCFGVYFKNYNKSFFRVTDGLEQHYIIFMNCGKWLREIFKNIFINHSFVIPLWNNGIGYGADILTSNGAYYPDVFNWLSMFIPSRFSELGFNIVLILKFYVAGLAFSYFGFYKKQSFWAVLTGTIIYVFSGVMYVAFIESFFMNPMYILPIVMVGVDKLLREKKSIIYVISLAYTFINYFYFGYMIGIFIFIYCLLSFCLDKDIERNVKNFWEIILRFAICSIIAIGISIVVVLPILMVLGGAGRLGLETYIPKLYEKKWYTGFAKGFITSYSMSGRDAFIGFGALALPAVMCIFVQKNKYTKQKIEFILITIGLCIPFIGSVMNGFSYYSNRWSFVYALVVSYMVVLAMDEFRNLSKKNIIIVALCAFLYAGVIIIRLRQTEQAILTATLLMLFCTFICTISNWIYENTYKYLYLALGIVSVIVSSYYNYNEGFTNATKAEVDYGTAFGRVMNDGGVSLLNKIDASDGSRYDENNLGRIRNASWIYGISGMDFYISIYNNSIDTFHNKLGLLTGASPMDYHGLNKRTELDVLLGVKHYIVNSKNINNKPYGYDNLELETEDGKFLAYTQDNNTQIIYAFDKSIKQSDYDNLSPYDKEQVLMQALVVPDEEATNTLDELNIKNDIIDYELVADKNISINNNEYIVNKDKSIVDLNFKNISNSEIYVYFENVNYENDKISWYDINIEAYNDSSVISGAKETLGGCNYKNHMYGGKHYYLVNLGYIEQNVNKIKLKFAKGNYSIDNIVVYAKPKNEIYNSIKNLKNVATDIKYSTNKFECNLKLDEKENVFISIPYSKGWKVYVNGEKVPVMKVDDAFMAINLEKRRI